jgi:cell division protein FtsW (lipid II flippase)
MLTGTGSSLVLLLVGFGILASIQRQQELKPS